MNWLRRARKAAAGQRVTLLTSSGQRTRSPNSTSWAPTGIGCCATAWRVVATIVGIR
ncbi:hypothetical protein I546_5457 [Mycobacterium kansasii 732]|nr:hypothetical protein I546_5457 [Mycobacterium kansasii 732]